jgi:cytochrome c
MKARAALLHRSFQPLQPEDLAMKSHLLIPIVGTALLLAAVAARPADDKARVPSTTAAQNSARLISSAERAIDHFVAACAARDVRGLSDVTTGEVRVEYALDDPGTYLSMDASSLIAACAANTPAARPGSRVSNFWIFPTNDPNTVFVQYDAPVEANDAAPHRQLALVEMQGERISRMLNFAAVPRSFVAAIVQGAAAAGDGRTAFDNYCRTCHSVKPGDVRVGPSLYGIYGARTAGITWNETTLDRFIENPDQVISNNMKPYAGIADPAVRQKIIEYLKSNRDLQGRN